MYVSLIHTYLNVYVSPQIVYLHKLQKYFNGATNSNSKEGV